MRNSIKGTSAVALARKEERHGQRYAQVYMRACYLVLASWLYRQALQGHALRRRALLQLLRSSASCIWGPHAAWGVLHDMYIKPPELLGLEHIQKCLLLGVLCLTRISSLGSCLAENILQSLNPCRQRFQSYVGHCVLRSRTPQRDVCPLIRPFMFCF